MLSPTRCRLEVVLSTLHAPNHEAPPSFPVYPLFLFHLGSPLEDSAELHVRVPCEAQPSLWVLTLPPVWPHLLPHLRTQLPEDRITRSLRQPRLYAYASSNPQQLRRLVFFGSSEVADMLFFFIRVHEKKVRVGNENESIFMKLVCYPTKLIIFWCYSRVHVRFEKNKSAKCSSFEGESPFFWSLMQ